MTLEPADWNKNYHGSLVFEQQLMLFNEELKALVDMGGYQYCLDFSFFFRKMGWNSGLAPPPPSLENVLPLLIS